MHLMAHRSWSFTIPGPPRGKGRPRFGNGRAYTDKATEAYERTIGDAALRSMLGVILEGPVAVDLLIVVARPKRLLRRQDPDGLLWAPVRPDADNVRKAILDGLKRHWKDDAQVCGGATVKVYAERGCEPRVEVTVRELPDDPMDEINRYLWSTPCGPGAKKGDQ